MTPDYFEFIKDVRKVVPEATIRVLSRPLICPVVILEVSWPWQGMERVEREVLDLKRLRSGIKQDCERSAYQRLLHRVGTAALEDKIGADED